MVIFFLRIVPFFLGLFRYLLLGLVFLFLISFIAQWDISQWNPQLAKNQQLQYLLDMDKTISKPFDAAIQTIVPPVYKVDITPIIKIIFCLALFFYLKRYVKRLKPYIKYRVQRDKLLRWRTQVNVPQNNSLYIELEQKLNEMSRITDKKKSQKLYLEITALKKKLESKSRYFAFLSMDIVDSTGMKRDEDKSLIQLDFIRFKRMVQTIFDKNGCVKSAWTPDGVMACFNSVNNAVVSAQDTLKELTNFNKKVKQISRDFIVRAGIHAGYIYYDDKLPLEEISDQVIDIAGHMQKHAQPSTIAISKLSIKPVDNSAGFTNKGQVIDGLEVYQWS